MPVEGVLNPNGCVLNPNGCVLSRRCGILWDDA